MKIGEGKGKKILSPNNTYKHEYLEKKEGKVGGEGGGVRKEGRKKMPSPNSTSKHENLGKKKEGKVGGGEGGRVRKKGREKKKN